MMNYNFKDYDKVEYKKARLEADSCFDQINSSLFEMQQPAYWESNFDTHNEFESIDLFLESIDKVYSLFAKAEACVHRVYPFSVDRSSKSRYQAESNKLGEEVMTLIDDLRDIRDELDLVYVDLRKIRWTWEYEHYEDTDITSKYKSMSVMFERFRKFRRNFIDAGDRYVSFLKVQPFNCFDRSTVCKGYDPDTKQWTFGRAEHYCDGFRIINSSNKVTEVSDVFRNTLSSDSKCMFIYEGDIVKIRQDAWGDAGPNEYDPDCYVVTYSSRYCAFVLKKSCVSDDNTAVIFGRDVDPARCLIVGNICENPEMLKDE